MRRVWGPREKKHGRVDGGRHWRCVSRLEPVLDVGEKSTQEFTYELIEAQRDIPRGEGKMRGRKGTMENEARQDDKLVSGWSKKARDEFTRKGREIK